MAETSAANAKLVQYLNEAYGLESRLETALEAHITMATQATYKKRLKQHLSETKRHGREVKKRLKQLGGTPASVETPGPAPVSDVAQAVLGGAQKAVALVQGPLHALRGTGEEEKQLKNAKTEYASESEEVATYTAIETLAKALGDRETQRLARAILRDEERMRSYLEKEIPRLTMAVVKAEIPASQRGKSTRAKAASPRGKATPTRAKATPTRGKATSTRGKATSARAKATPTRGKTVSSRAKATPTRTKAVSSRTKAASTRARTGRSVQKKVVGKR